MSIHIVRLVTWKNIIKFVTQICAGVIGSSIWRETHYCKMIWYNKSHNIISKKDDRNSVFIDLWINWLLNSRRLTTKRNYNYITNNKKVKEDQLYLLICVRYYILLSISNLNSNICFFCTTIQKWSFVRFLRFCALFALRAKKKAVLPYTLVY